MAMAANRPYGQQPTYPSSPAPTTASSLNYSTYASSQFASPSRNPSANVSVSSSSYARGPTRAPSDGPGLKPPGGSGSVRPKGESREVAKVHWTALKDFLREWLEKESPTARASAREKLTRLTKLQFQELSTDVYDELMRRTAIENGVGNNEPFLAVREDFHPKRNQARQKLATLPKNRFKDLASDVFHELRRRYPDFDEEESVSRSQSQMRGPDRSRSYDEPPPAPGPTTRPSYGSAQSQSQPGSFREREQPRGNPTPPPVSRLNSTGHSRSGSRNISAGSSVGSGTLHRPRPSRDNTREYLDQPGGQGGYGHQPTAATNDVVVPNKSRMKEEEIEVPYARESIMDRPLSTASSRSRLSSMHDQSGTRTPGREREQQEMLSPQTADEREYYDRMSFSSNLTNKSRALGQSGADEEREKKIVAEYEYKIAGLERRIAGMEEAERRSKENTERTRELEDEVRGLKERAALHASNLRSLQHELDLARDAAESARNHTDQSGRAAQDEINQWRDRCDGLEDELRRVEMEKQALETANGASGNGQSGEMVAELKNEIHNLVDELNALSARNDDLVMERENDAQAMNEMEAQVAEWKRKHDAVRIELRNLKATSTMFVSKPANDDHLPASPDGNIADVHVSAFQSAIDGMLAAGRSSAPSGVLPAMKAIVEAITDIGEDVKRFEASPNLDVDVSRLESLKHESTTRLNYLMQAARNHAMASGLSPVSLIDAAAGHLSANVVEIIKLLKIKRTNKTGEVGPGGVGMRPSRSSMSIKDMVDRTRTATPDSSVRAPSRNAYGGPEERLREQPQVDTASQPHPPSRQLSVDDGRSMRSPIESRSNQPPAMSGLRINSYQSVASSIARSDSFDLERKASVLSDRQGAAPQVQRGGVYDERLGGSGNGMGNGGYARLSEASETSASASSAVAPITAERNGGEGYRFNEHDEQEVFSNEGGNEQEWDDVKPYLETQSSALVNSIQNLLAAIRTGTHTPALNEHLSEVIAIASSIVAISTNALPPSLRGEGGPLLKDLVANTNKLSEAQEQAKGGGFDKAVRQVIASASFGVAKSLKSLMKLGAE